MSNEYSFEAAKREWAKPPTDDIGYIPSSEIMDKSDELLRSYVEIFERNRYTGWRNVDDMWRSTLGLDTTENSVVMDFGCGVGIEALQFAKKGNKVLLADISEDNLTLAHKILELYGHDTSTFLVSGEAPYFDDPPALDVFYSNGVLHHTPHIRGILRRACDCLKPDGEIRLMLYSDRAWKRTFGVMPPGTEKACYNVGFGKFIRAYDGVGKYADWYNFKKLREVCGDFLEIVDYNYICEAKGFFGFYLTATLVRR